MAVFMLNICKFDGCGITFPTLADLILHIEDTHIDCDPAVIEQKEQQQPDCLPLSYVLKFFTNSTRRDSHMLDLKQRLIQHASKNSIRSTTPPGSEHEDEEICTESENSNESWTTSEEFSSEFILRYGSRLNTSSPSFISPEKPFACPVPGCKKRYKNINGIKYHSKNGHKKDGKIKKGYKCHCGKSYKTAQGLKNHTNIRHTSSSLALTGINDVHQNQLTIPSATRTVSVKQSTNNGDVKTLHNLVTKQSEFKTLDIARLKNFIENNKRNRKLAETEGSDLGIITPATSPDSSPNEKVFHSSSLVHMTENPIMVNSSIYDF